MCEIRFKNILMDSSENLLFPLPDSYEQSWEELEFSTEKRWLRADCKYSFMDDIHQPFFILTEEGIYSA